MPTARLAFLCCCVVLQAAAHDCESLPRDISLLQIKTKSSPEPPITEKLIDQFDRDFVRDNDNKLEQFSESQGEAEDATKGQAGDTVLDSFSESEGNAEDVKASQEARQLSGKISAVSNTSNSASLSHVANGTEAPALTTTPAASSTTVARTTLGRSTEGPTVELVKPTQSGSANVSQTCATRQDDRIEAWVVDTAKPGTQCLFGVDDRDEGKHCIHDDGKFGSYGWCWTQADWGSWGSCNEHCPLAGPPAAIAKKLDHVQSIIHKLATDLGHPEAPDEKAKLVNTTALLSAGEATAEAKKPESAAKDGVAHPVIQDTKRHVF